MVEKISKTKILLVSIAFLLVAFTDTSAADTLVSGEISTDTTWTVSGSPYIVTGDIVIYNSTNTPTLTIEPGVTVSFNQYTRLNVGSGSYGGRLIADNVIFTGSSATSGWWGGIYFDQNSDGSIINNSRVMYGGYWYNANIYLNSASVNITNSIIAASSNYGIYSSGNGDKINIINNRIQNNINYGIYSTGSGSAVVFNNQISNNIGGGAYFDSSSYSSLIVQNNVFAGNGNYPLTFNAAYIDSIKDNTFTANVPNEIQLSGGTISNPVSTMRNQEVPYIVAGDIFVYKISVSPAILIINPGITLKFNQYTRLNIGSGSYGGRLIADNVTFTGSSATNGWWGGIYFDQNSDGSIINNTRVMYGGYWYSANIYLNSASINITNNTIANSSYYGIYLTDSTSALIKDNYISNNEYGLSLSSSGSTIYNNYFNNTNNVLFGGTIYNTWNISKQAGVNIVGGPYLGGNFWANPEDSGFSQTCTDSDSDGICDSSYMLDTNNIDYLPLARIA